MIILELIEEFTVAFIVVNSSLLRIPPFITRMQLFSCCFSSNVIIDPVCLKKGSLMVLRSFGLLIDKN